MPVDGIAQVVRDIPKNNDPNLLIGADGASDAAIYRLREDLLIVQSLDFFPPLVDDPFVFGQIAAANSLSDVFAMGGEPKTALNIVGFPDDKLDLSILQEILAGGGERTILAGANVAGGHTVRDAEIKFGLSVTGIVHPDELMSNQGAAPGDVLVLTKALGTGFITTAFKANKCPEDVLQSAVDGMIQLNMIGRDVAKAARVKGVTDITGFGLAGHGSELALASEVTLEIDTKQLPLLTGAEPLLKQGFVTRASASNRSFVEKMMTIESTADASRLEFVFDAQTSGGLLMSVNEDKVDELIKRAHDQGATATCVIGTVKEKASVPLVFR